MEEAVIGVEVVIAIEVVIAMEVATSMEIVIAVEEAIARVRSEPGQGSWTCHHSGVAIEAAGHGPPRRTE